MNQEKVGKFIAQKRKEKNLKQEELGAILGVSSKTISRWETGRNMPDLAMFKPLCELLDVNLNDLFRGEAAPAENIPKDNHKKIIIVIFSIMFLLILYRIIFNIIYFSSYNENYFALLDNRLNIFPFINAFLGLEYGFYGAFIQNIVSNFVITLFILGALKYFKIPNHQLFLIFLTIIVTIQLLKWLLLLGIYDIDDILMQIGFYFILKKFFDIKYVKKL